MGATDQRQDTGHQLGEVERLGQIVVGAAFQTANSRIQLIARRQQKDRRRDASPAQLLDHRKPVPVGEHDVEHDAVILAGQSAFHRLVTRRGRVHRVTLLTEGLAQEASKAPIVLDQ